MKFKDERPFASVNAGVKKLLEIASAMEADPAGRLHIGPINQQFLEAGASVSEYSSAKSHDRPRLPHPAPLRRLCDVHSGGRGPIRMRPFKG